MFGHRRHLQYRNQVEPKVSCLKPSRLTTGHFHVDSALYFPNVSLAVSHDSHIRSQPTSSPWTLTWLELLATLTSLLYSCQLIVLCQTNDEQRSHSNRLCTFILDQFPPWDASLSRRKDFERGIWAIFVLSIAPSPNSISLFNLKAVFFTGLKHDASLAGWSLGGSNWLANSLTKAIYT